MNRTSTFNVCLFQFCRTGRVSIGTVLCNECARVNKSNVQRPFCSSPTSALPHHHICQSPTLGFGPGRVQQHHVHVLIGHGDAAGGALVHGLVGSPLTLDVGVEQGGVVGGVDHGEGTDALAVVDVGRAGTDGQSFQGHGEARQPAVFLPGWGVGVGSDGPQAPLPLVGPADCLQGLQQQEGPVLALSWRQETGE